jgi:hypothetical protein
VSCISSPPAAISGICRRLDGIPLAIELAGARAAVLGVEELAARLDGRFHVLTGGRRTALPRPQTLTATLAWSYDLLAWFDTAEPVAAAAPRGPASLLEALLIQNQRYITPAQAAPTS